MRNPSGPRSCWDTVGRGWLPLPSEVGQPVSTGKETCFQQIVTWEEQNITAGIVAPG